MKRSITLKVGVLAAAVGLVVSGGAFGGDSVTQTFDIAVDAINEIGVSAQPGDMTVVAATAGSQPDAVQDASTTYALTTNGTGMKITAALNSAMPDDVTLTLNVAAPTTGTANGTSAGAVALTATAQDMVTGIQEVAESGMALSYDLDADVAAGIVSAVEKVVTLTITSGS